MFKSITGMRGVQVESADIAAFLTELNKASVAVYQTKFVDELTCRFDIHRRDYASALRIAKRMGAQLHIVKNKGAYWTMMRVVKRPVILFGILLLMYATLYLPGKVLFICVEGNTSVPTKLILEKAADSGIRFGADRRTVRSEKVKNSLLQSIEQLQWAGINTNGCVATISVRERTAPESTQPSHSVGSIVAVRDGVIESFTVTRGNGLCSVGQAVREGEVLISGYTDCGISIQATRAEGEVYARTMRKIAAVTPANAVNRGARSGSVKRYGLILGKKRINFYNDSGILDISCDKMYKEYYLTLPGGFQLPVALVVETWYTYDTQVISASEETAQNEMTRYVRDYLHQQMLGGEILSSSESLIQGEDVYILNGEYMCLEMIGRVRSEEIIGNNG